MKIKKLFTGLLAVTVLAMATLTVSADTTKEPVVISEQEEVFQFGSFIGTVVEINDFTPIKGGKMIGLEEDNGNPINMIVTQDTYVVKDAEIKVGSKVTGYFDANAPMIMIYPPQYNPEVVVVENDDYQVKVDVFSEELLSSDNMLKLNISEDTKIMTQDGQTFEGKLKGGRLVVVVYDFSTKSIPAQTTPIQITVLNEGKVEDLEEAESDKGLLMVPLRSTANALDFQVIWESKLESIYVGIAASLKIDQDEYVFAKMAPMKLGAAPALVDGTTFVPLDFFTKVLQLDQEQVLEVLEDHIVIN